MEWKLTVLCVCACLGTITAMQVTVTSEWKPDIGWELSCSWQLFSNDSLQSVRMYYNEQQFLIYRPEEDGDKRSGIYRRPEDMMTINCEETSDRGVTGTCELTMELYQPQKNSFTFACEASGERPTFRIERKAIVIEAFVPPTDAVVEVGSVNAESGRVMLNCTSSGVPAPNLVWTVGEQKVPRDFSGSFWNATSKLWHVWSVLSYTHSNEHPAVCTPETSKGSKVVQGEPAEYNSAGDVKDIKSILFAVLTSLLLLS
ncbi:uncharacterized protein LOC113495763 [Trichoplusia ni]|uniref:Uncharacterized protein LOC113495763 n=1 Tax=Trichoplusia ni TaxID=7111 RepID=A0A7E5VQC2_TRINI|nr:uncharacterized protein LOC113495763 [Trichoplusia ni]